MRTNIVIDDALVRRVMRLYGLKSKREAVDFALRRAAGGDPHERALALEGSGWEGDLERLREQRVTPL